MNDNLKQNIKPMLKIGVIGLGRMGLMHSAVFNSLDHSRLVAVTDPSKFPAKILGDINKSIKVYKDAAEMINTEELDAVLISSPVNSHIELSLLCSENKIPFLLEKPLSINAKEALPLIESLNESKIQNMIGYVYRFLDSFVKGKEILDTGCLGNIQRVNSNIYISQLFKKGKGWRYDPKLSGGGVLIGLGSHVIDLLTWYFGNVLTVSGKVKSVYSEGIDDFAHLMLAHENGIDSVLDASWSVRFKRKIDVKIDILGDNGTLIVTEDTIVLFLDKPAGGWPAGKTVLTANELFTPVPVDIGTPKFTFQNLHFVNSIVNGTMPMPDIIQAYHVQQIVDAGYLSSDQNLLPIEIDQLKN